MTNGDELCATCGYLTRTRSAFERLADFFEITPDELREAARAIRKEKQSHETVKLTKPIPREQLALTFFAATLQTSMNSAYKEGLPDNTVEDRFKGHMKSAWEMAEMWEEVRDNM